MLTASDGINLSDAVKLNVLIGERGDIPDGVRVICTPNNARKTYDDYKRVCLVIDIYPHITK